MTTAQFHVQLASEDALIVYAEADSIATSNGLIRALDGLITAELGQVVIETTPSYGSILVRFDPYKTDHFHLRQKLKHLTSVCVCQEQTAEQLVTLPVYYSVESGPDLQRIAEFAGLSIEEVIEIHQAQVYQVFAIGFAPGFAYLGEVDPRLALPRLSTPRAQVPKGAVAIAERQTAIYPAPSPGGWNIVGLCPVDLFSPDSNCPMPYKVGDNVRFEAINKQEFIDLGGQL